jgi:hypothetical protein
LNGLGSTRRRLEIYAHSGLSGFLQRCCAVRIALPLEFLLGGFEVRNALGDLVSLCARAGFIFAHFLIHPDTCSSQKRLRFGREWDTSLAEL